MPREWKVKPASDIYNITIGKTPPRKEQHWFSLDDEDIKWASIKDMGDSGIVILNTSEYLTREAVKKFNVQVIPKGSVLLSFKLTLGRVCIADENICTNEAIAHFRIGKNTPDSFWTLLFLKQFDFNNLGSTSSIATAVNSKIIKSMPILFPDSLVTEAFTTYGKNILKKIRNNSCEIQSLTKLRDTLLPKLVSGEVRVPE